MEFCHGKYHKKDLVEKISNSTGLTQVDTKIVVESFLEAVSKALREGKNIEIRGSAGLKSRKKGPHGPQSPHQRAHPGRGRIQTRVRGFKRTQETDKRQLLEEPRRTVAGRRPPRPDWSEE